MCERHVGREAEGAKSDINYIVVKLGICREKKKKQKWSHHGRIKFIEVFVFILPRKHYIYLIVIKRPFLRQDLYDHLCGVAQAAVGTCEEGEARCML